MRNHVHLLAVGFTLLLSTAEVMAFCSPFAPDTLEEYEVGLEKSYTGFPHWTPSALQERMNSDAPLVLLDVREADEFAVSHLPGAIRIDPDASLAQLRRTVGTLAPKTTVVFYCAVGSRSSRLAKRVIKNLLANGAESVVNLRGGIFAWHKAGFLAVNADGPTTEVHPYDECRGKLMQPPLNAAAP